MFATFTISGNSFINHNFFDVATADSLDLANQIIVAAARSGNWYNLSIKIEHDDEEV